MEKSSHFLYYIKTAKNTKDHELMNNIYQCCKSGNSVMRKKYQKIHTKKSKHVKTDIKFTDLPPHIHRIVDEQMNEIKTGRLSPNYLYDSYHNDANHALIRFDGDNLNTVLTFSYNTKMECIEVDAFWSNYGGATLFNFLINAIKCAIAQSKNPEIYNNTLYLKSIKDINTLAFYKNFDFMQLSNKNQSIDHDLMELERNISLESSRPSSRQNSYKVSIDEKMDKNMIETYNLYNKQTHTLLWFNPDVSISIEESYYKQLRNDNHVYPEKSNFDDEDYRYNIKRKLADIYDSKIFDNTKFKDFFIIENHASLNEKTNIHRIQDEEEVNELIKDDLLFDAFIVIENNSEIKNRYYEFALIDFSLSENAIEIKSLEINPLIQNPSIFDFLNNMCKKLGIEKITHELSPEEDGSIYKKNGFKCNENICTKYTTKRKKSLKRLKRTNSKTMKSQRLTIGD